MRRQVPFYTYKLQLLLFAHELLKYKLDEHFKMAYKFFLFSNAKQGIWDPPSLLIFHENLGLFQLSYVAVA